MGSESERKLDLLHALKDVESDHRISAERGVRGSNPHSRGTGSIPGEISFPPLYMAVARSNRPHQNPCHRRANHRWSAAPCGSGPASHQFRSTPCYTGPCRNTRHSREGGGMRSYLYHGLGRSAGESFGTRRCRCDAVSDPFVDGSVDVVPHLVGRLLAVDGNEGGVVGVVVDDGPGVLIEDV